MSYSYLYTPVAAKDYTEALGWYAERSIKAAENFVSAVKEKLTLICNNPERFALRYRKFREASLKKYPFSIIYFVNETEKVIVVTAVYHHRRNPASKYNRKKML
jgi:plasmid stabilization system protein ParE